MAANRLANNSKTWYEVFSKNNSGTGNKQWLVISANNTSIEFGVVEQMPGIVGYDELSQTLLSNGYWISNGYPSLEVSRSSRLVEYYRYAITSGPIHAYSDAFTVSFRGEGGGGAEMISEEILTLRWNSARPIHTHIVYRGGGGEGHTR